MAQASDESHAIAGETLEQLISWRTFKLYQWFGLIELREQASECRGFPYRGPLSLRATKLFDAVLAFA